jgi:hypothetical protein
MKKKIRKFQEGGFSAEQEEWLGGADRTDPYILARMRRAVPDKKPMASAGGDDSPAGKTGYGEENELPATTRVTPTKTIGTKPTVKPTAKPSAPTMPQEEKDRLAALEKKQALTPVRPEEMLIGGGGLKVLQMAGKKLAEKIAGNRGLKEYVVPKLSGPSSSSKTPALPSPTPKLPYDKAGALSKKRADRAEARDIDMKRSNAENYGIDPDAPGSYSALQSLRRNIGDGEFSMKKGGKVKAKTYKSGGSVSGASKRADGIATKGKTRGKMC